MNESLVLTIIGMDRPGLVEKLSDRVTSHGGNWEESRMSHLAGKFAGILLLTVPADYRQTLVQSLQALEQEGLKVVIEQSEKESPVETYRLLHLELVGHDRPGIVKQISHAIARHHINVEELNTTCGSAPMSGESLFKADARLRCPADVPITELQQELEKIAHDLMVDITLADQTQ